MAQYSRRYSVVMSKWHFTWCWNAFITLVALHNSKLPECIYTEGHIAFIPGWFALKRMYMSDCTFAMSDCISQMLETHFGILICPKTLPTKPRDFSGQSSSSSSDSSTINICPSENPRVQSRTFGSAMTPQVNAMLVNTFLMTFVSEAFYAL